MPSLIRIPRKAFEKKVRSLFIGWWVILLRIKLGVIDEIIYPNKKSFLFTSIIISFIFGSIIAFIKENKKNLIYEKEDLEKLINCDYIETLNDGEIKLNNELILRTDKGLHCDPEKSVKNIVEII